MPFKAGDPRPEGAGRKAGTPNKFTADARAALHEAFEEMGGVEALVKWAWTDRAEFYKLWAKTIPKNLEMTGKGGEPIKIIVVTGVPDADPKKAEGAGGNG
jgi:hypothetical protein